MASAKPSVHARKAQTAAKPAPKAEENVQAAAQGLDAEAFRRNFIAGLSGRRNAPALSPDNVRILSTEKAAAFAGTDIYAVRGELTPADGQAQPFTLFVSADGRFYVSDIIDLAPGKASSSPRATRCRPRTSRSSAMSSPRARPAHGGLRVRPVLPYCRMAFAFLMEKPQAFAELPPRPFSPVLALRGGHRLRAHGLGRGQGPGQGR
jgi:hypothetical protein